MKKLIKGLHTFQSEVFPIQEDYFKELTKGQFPEVLFITCSDSRINPHLITQTDPGDLFIIRNAGNIIPVYGSHGGEEATLEFAIHELHIQHIIVCGHSYCGAIAAAVKGVNKEAMPNFAAWVEKNIKPTLQFVQNNYQDLNEEILLDILTQENVLQQIEQLKTHPIVIKKIKQNKLTLHAWVYQFETGEIFSYDSHDEQFKAIKRINS